MLLTRRDPPLGCRLIAASGTALLWRPELIPARLGYVMGGTNRNHLLSYSSFLVSPSAWAFTTTGIALRDNDVSNYAQTLPVVCAPSRTFLIAPHRATRAMQSQLCAFLFPCKARGVRILICVELQLAP